MIILRRPYVDGTTVHDRLEQLKREVDRIVDEINAAALDTDTREREIVKIIEKGGGGSGEMPAFLRTSEMDFSAWANGTFTETLEDGRVNTYTVEFDESDRPVKITDDDGHVCEVVWE